MQILKFILTFETPCTFMFYIIVARCVHISKRKIASYLKLKKDDRLLKNSLTRSRP